jgi:hypothetical protein
MTVRDVGGLLGVSPQWVSQTRGDRCCRALNRGTETCEGAPAMSFSAHAHSTARGGGGHLLGREFEKV